VKIDVDGCSVADVCSVVVVDRPLAEYERPLLEEYLRTGGAIIGYAEYLARVAGTSARREQLEYLVADPAEYAYGVELMDLGIYGSVPREANALRTQENTFALFWGSLGGGHAVILPFDVAAVMTDDRTAFKNFYAPRERLPAERVSLVSKGEVRHLLHRSFEYLHHVRGLPYVHLWHVPHGQRNISAFRVDTDTSKRDEVDALYRIARDNGVGLSWYLDVKSHETWLQHFRFMVDQEIGIHCYEHHTYPDVEANLKNISRARHVLDAAGLAAVGFTAPYGTWSHALAGAVDRLGFEYSSEFSFAYDTLPLYPELNGTPYHTLQIPIHPICIGSLKRIGYTDGQARDYFRMVIERKLLRDEPLFFYHHPSHRGWEIVRFIFQLLAERGIENTTFADYGRWWKTRVQTAASMIIDLEAEILESRSSGPDVIENTHWLHITNVGDREQLVPFGSRIDLAKTDPDMTRQKATVPADIRRIRKFDVRAMLGELYTTLVRKLT
jgi:hypothetical protein